MTRFTTVWERMKDEIEKEESDAKDKTLKAEDNKAAMEGSQSSAGSAPLV
jgi:hypothetical protein